jgi:Ca2+-binding RTX toxin-like protein
VSGGSKLASYTFTADNFNGAFSLVLSGSDNKTGADTLNISKDELGINGNSIQPGEVLKIDVQQSAGYGTASLTSLTIGIASTGSLAKGDVFNLVAYGMTLGANPQATSELVPVTYDGSGSLVFQIPGGMVIDYVTLATAADSNSNFKITGMSVEYTQPIDPSDMNLQFTATGVDTDGDIVSDSFNVNLIAGTAGNDNLLTGITNDTVSGGDGSDTINTGAGNDTLIGGTGSDVMTGGLGSDTFKWSLNDTGSDKITDFNLAPVELGGDVLDLKDLLVGEHSTAASLDSYLNFSANTLGQTVITVDANAGATGGTGQTITLENVQFTALQTYAGGNDDVAIITKLLNEGNLKTDI